MWSRTTNPPPSLALDSKSFRHLGKLGFEIHHHNTKRLVYYGIGRFQNHCTVLRHKYEALKGELTWTLKTLASSGSVVALIILPMIGRLKSRRLDIKFWFAVHH